MSRPVGFVITLVTGVVVAGAGIKLFPASPAAPRTPAPTAIAPPPAEPTPPPSEATPSEADAGAALAAGAEGGATGAAAAPTAAGESAPDATAPAPVAEAEHEGAKADTGKEDTGKEDTGKEAAANDGTVKEDAKSKKRRKTREERAAEAAADEKEKTAASAAPATGEAEGEPHAKAGDAGAAAAEKAATGPGDGGAAIDSSKSGEGGPLGAKEGGAGDCGLAEKDIAREAWRRNWPTLCTVPPGGKAFILIPTKGSIEGAVVQLKRRPTREARVVLPQAESLLTLPQYKLKKLGFKDLRVQKLDDGGTKLRVKLQTGAGDPVFDVKDGYVKITVAPPEKN